MLGGVREWLQYRQDAFGNPTAVWTDGPDFDLIRTRWTADPEFVEALIAHGLLARDPLAAEALTHLDLDPEARQRFSRVLRDCLDSRAVAFHLRAVQALYLLTSDESWSAEVVRVLLGAGFWSDRREAARIAGRFSPTCSVIRALSQAIEDPDFLVRREAAMALLSFAALVPDARLLAEIGTRATPAQWAAAARGIAERATMVADSH